MYPWLVVWIMFFFHSVGNNKFKLDELIFFRGVETTDDKIVEVENQKLFSQDHGEAVSRKAARGRIFCSSTSP
jgi:hypothetical protein